jgi:hypothetical protein
VRIDLPVDEGDASFGPIRATVDRESVRLRIGKWVHGSMGWRTCCVRRLRLPPRKATSYVGQEYGERHLVPDLERLIQQEHVDTGHHRVTVFDEDPSSMANRQGDVAPGSGLEMIGIVCFRNSMGAMVYSVTTSDSSGVRRVPTVKIFP